MIERYTRKEMGNIWSEENKFKKWLEVEIAVCKGWSELGVIPKDAFERIKEKAHIDEETVKKIKEYDKKYKHDVLAFVSAINDQMGSDSRYFHMGVTSSDIIDTAFALLIREAIDLLLKDISEVMDILKELSYRYKNTIMMGRTHGVHAEPTTFGIKMASWYDEMKRNRERLERCKEVISYGKISGAVGTYSNVDPEVERIALDYLGLKIEPASTQIVHRDRHAEVMTTLAIIASSLEKFATEIRHLQRTEVLEVQEPFSKGQRGSSAMPHKKNPIHSERICGLARVIRSFSITSLENIPLWHERDISHSSAERIIFPDAFIGLNYMLNLFMDIMKGIRVYEDNMLRNMKVSYNLFFSSKLLVELMKRGMERDKAYDVVQKLAMESWEKRVDFKEIVKGNEEIRSIFSDDDIEGVFDPSSFLRNIDYIFKKVFGSA